MKKNLTEIVFILDRSGSMGGLEKDTIGGFNGMLKKQKKETEAGEALVSVVLFDDKVENLYDRVPIADVKEMTNKEYYVRGCTALLDAIGFTIDHIKAERKAMPKEERPEKTIFIITTDGMENSSHEYTYDRVKAKIEKRQEKGWEFLFLGANIDAAKEAGKMGIKASRAVNYHCDAAGTALNYCVLSDAVSDMRCAPSVAKMGAMMDKGHHLARIRKDFKSRKAD